MTRIATLAACIALLAACSRHEPPAAAKPPAHTPASATAALPAPQALDDAHDDAIMRALFGTAYDAAERYARTTITVDGAQREVVMSLVAAATLPDGRVGVIVNGMPTEVDLGFPGYVMNGILNVYVLQHAGNAWTVAARHEHADALGSQGHLGDARWIMLGPGKPGFIVSTNGKLDGYAVRAASIYELGKEVSRLGGFMEASDSAAACRPGLDLCWNYNSHTRLADEVQPDGYRDILVDFEGKRHAFEAGRDSKDVEHLESAARQTARYRFDGKAYVLKDGTNPVPAV